VSVEDGRKVFIELSIYVEGILKYFADWKLEGKYETTIETENPNTLLIRQLISMELVYWGSYLLKS